MGHEDDTAAIESERRGDSIPLKPLAVAAVKLDHHHDKSFLGKPLHYTSIGALATPSRLKFRCNATTSRLNLASAL